MNKRKYLTNLITFLLVLFPTLLHCSSKIQTSRLKSTAGIGVGAILLDEATMLNPAPLAFYQVGALYYQKSKMEGGSSDDNLGNTLFVASDSKGRIGGSISYFTDESDKLISVSLASPVSDKSALGVTYHYKESINPLKEEEKIKYFTMGVSHAISENVTLGIVANDPTNEISNESQVIVGGQFTYKEFISLMGDFGVNWREEISSSLYYGAGVQFKVYQDFFIRLGGSRDKGSNKRVTGTGASWVSPKVVFNLALNFTKQDSEEVKDSSFSVSYKF